MSTGSPLRIGVLAYPGCIASEVFGVPDLLTIASHVARAAGGVGAPCEVSIVSPRRRVAASGGAPIAVTSLREVDILIVPGFELAPGLDLDATLASLGPEVAAIRAHRQSGAALVTICVGAFLAAAAGVLDGRQATTSWLFADALCRRHPTVDVRAENLTITDAGVTTTAAFSAMYDLALNMIRQPSGAAVARRNRTHRAGRRRPLHPSPIRRSAAATHRRHSVLRLGPAMAGSTPALQLPPAQPGRSFRSAPGRC